jgi:uncharacterized damage-inducible protein DinB
MVGRGTRPVCGGAALEDGVARCADAVKNRWMRVDPIGTATEAELLAQYLEFQRETVILKTDGLDRGQMSRTHPPSTLSLGGILNHLALVENYWSEVRFQGLPEREPWASVEWTTDPDWEFRAAAELPPDVLRDRYRRAGDRTGQTVLRAPSLEQLSATPLAGGEKFSLRWMLLHLIEETARHAGHADLIREAIDGTVGE